MNHCNLYLPIQAHSPQQNGVAKWKNRTILDIAKSMALNCGLLKTIWIKVVNVTNYLINRSPTKANSSISFEEKLKTRYLTCPISVHY
jgi:hypothetical protein